MVFRLDCGQISFNLVQKAFATQQLLALLATSITFMTFLLGHASFSSFEIFFAFPFFSFSFLFAAVIALLLGLLAVKKLLRKPYQDRAN